MAIIIIYFARLEFLFYRRQVQCFLIVLVQICDDGGESNLFIRGTQVLKKTRLEIGRVGFDFLEENGQEKLHLFFTRNLKVDTVLIEFWFGSFNESNGSGSFGFFPFNLFLQEFCCFQSVCFFLFFLKYLGSQLFFKFILNCLFFSFFHLLIFLNSLDDNYILSRCTCCTSY